MLGLRRSSTFEGEAAQALQYAAQAASPGRMAEKPETLAEIRQEREDFFSVDMGKLLDYICRERTAGMSAEPLARLFHETLAAAVCAGCEIIREKTGLSLVGLTGGCFSNRLLAELTREKLLDTGFRVLTHRQIPSGDGGLALGQALYGMYRLQNMKERQ
jgi:hydrogenase maturation protein HypF